MADDPDNKEKKKEPTDEEIIEAVAALIVAGMSIYKFCDIPCHALILSQNFYAN